MVSPAVGQNLVVNGSFEADPCTGSGAGYKLGLAGNAVTGWNIPASDGTYPWCLQNANFFNAGPTPYGNQWLVLGEVGSGVAYTIQQTLTGLTPGSMYKLSFAIASEQGCCSVAEVSFPSGSSTTAQTFTAPASGNYWTAWATETMNFTATSNSVTLQFKNLVSAQPATLPNGYDLGLDNVSVAPAGGDQCAGALPVGNATGCGALVTFTTDTSGNLVATVTTPVNGNPYDGAEDTLVGIQNNSGATLNSIDLSSSTTPVFGFDGDGICQFSGGTLGVLSRDCFANGTTGYEGPNNTFTNINSGFTTGTVNFTTPIGPNGTAWFALEGQPSSVSSVSASSFTTPPQPITQGVTNNVTFTDGTKINQNAVIPSDANLNGAASMAVKFTEVAPGKFDTTRLPATAPNTWSGGTAVPDGTTCLPIPSANNNCVVIEEVCFSDAAGKISIPCNLIAGTSGLIDLKSVYTATLLPPNPGYFIASDNQNDWADITNLVLDCCTVGGGTRGVNTDYFIGDKPPVITITTPASGATYVLNLAVSANYTCIDPPQSPPSPLPSCTGANPGPVLNGSKIDTASLGSKTFTVSSTDAIGTSGTKSANYSVLYSTGQCLGDAGHQILQPINQDGTSVWKQGRTIPVKFRVCDANGASIGTAGVITSFTLSQIISGTIANVDETVDATIADSGFRFDPTAQQWVFNLSTNGQSAGFTYVYQINLNDGTAITFRYGLR
jgi:hypothetical protein